MNARPQLSLRPRVDAAMPEAAMVLAAGLGKRMRPLTATRPKPLIDVAGRSLLDRALDRIEAAGIGRAIVNVHYFADQVEAALAARKGPLQISVSDERGQLLETGGGLAKALPMMGSGPVLVANSDNLWIDGASDTLRLMANRWNADSMDALLLLVPLARATGYDGRGDFHLDPAGLVRPRSGVRLAPFVFAGVQIIHPRLFDGEPVEPFTMWRAWNKALEAGRMFGMAHQGLWFHVGTPDSIGTTERVLAGL
ncbi:nucleotidyltransferase family protein [Polymorphobacter sp.]|uniref:nucleotidyltransferase family protein n=1 Tax=Polymorphobacter sp. TaxID=1909290 RepID=UPI003F6F3900